MFLNLIMYSPKYKMLDSGVIEILDWSYQNLSFSWSIGYNGTPLYFVDDTTICFVNGNCIKFVNLTNGSVRYLHASSNGISTIAVNPSHGLVAFGENGLNAKIFVYEIKNLDKPISTIPGIKLRKAWL